MERRNDYTASETKRDRIQQNLTLEQLRKKQKPKEFSIKLHTVIGKGAFGKVYLVDLYKTTKEKVAMKVITREDRGKNLQIEPFNLPEIEIMSQLDNPYINKLIEYYFQLNEETKQEELILLQPLAMMDLYQFLQENYFEGGMPEKEAIEYLAQLAIGTKAMHDKQVIHRDLNPKNILVFKNDKPSNGLDFTLKISDFGCSRILEPHEYQAMTQGVGKVGFLAPEQMNNSVKGYNPKVDVYSLGLTMLQMLTGRVLNVADIVSRKPNLKQYSKEFIDLLYNLCSLDHEQRPTIDEIIDHPVLQKSHTFKNCLLGSILPMKISKMDRTIESSSALQKEFDALEKSYIDDFEQKFPFLEERIKRPLGNSLPEIGRVFYLMNKVQADFKNKEKEWPAQYEKAFGNNDEQFFKDKFLSCNQNALAESLKTIQKCKFKREVQSNGDIFVGYYKEDQINGFVQSKSYSKFYGRLYGQKSIKEGYLRNGMFHGETSEYVMYPSCQNYYYDGDYVDGSSNGYGLMIIGNGDMYCGEYKYGKRHGLGTYYWNDGDIYEGQYMNNDRHGEGVLKIASGDIFKGTWKEGDKHGEFIKTYASGKQEKTIFSMGKEVQSERRDMPRQEPKQNGCNQQ
eukprot:403350349